ncbi:uncharacterized protein Hap1MRO34_025470 isoform 1-T1 [Clarias gariepinus]|uniref:filamin-A-interacting protein 1-like isoform X1 n=1 Tax=Clarias gariepinus TaxID=13013 RepID=UPI00234CBC81|nr:filamin-A-interacting protein 1-like isoform X1 [Clarias gariepinus]
MSKSPVVVVFSLSCQTPQTGSLPKAKKKKQNDTNKRCRKELEEGLSNLQVVMNLQAELEQETLLRKKIEEKSDDVRKMEEAEQLSLRLWGEDHYAKIRHLQEKLRGEPEVVEHLTQTSCNYGLVAVKKEPARNLKSVLAELQGRDLTSEVQSTTQDVLKTELQEQDNLKLRQDIEKLEEFCGKLRTELQQVHCNLHFYIRKYDEMKVRHREKLAEAKQVYLREMAWRDQKIEEQEWELDILTKRLKKESDMVKMVMAENEALLLTKKTLLCQLHEAEQNRKNAADKIYTLQLRVDFLEKDSVQQWEMNMEKSTRIAKLERRLWDVESFKSSQYLRKHHGSHIIEGTKEARLSERGPEEAVIQKTKDGSVEKLALCASQGLSGGSEIGYMNILTHNLG